jgi:4-amino-4-deoxy-L-arabinose transferase-like glycosyltransferase
MAGEDMHLSGGAAARRVLALMALTALARCVLAGALGLSVDESYTAAISRRFELSYFDHPPLHLWLVGAWAKLWGSEQPLLLRLPDIALFAGSTWLIYRLTAEAFGERAGFLAALALNLTPLFTLNAAGGVLPDGPLVFFSLLAVRCFALALRAPQASPRVHAWMLAAGAATGLALLSKYTAIFLPLALALYLLSCRRRLLATSAPWLAVLEVLILFTPVVMWNAAHGWASFAFQGGRGWPQELRLGGAALDFAGQLAYLLPWTALAVLLAIARALRAGPRDEAPWLFAVLAALPIVAFTLVSLWAPTLPHWAAIGWLFGFPLLGERLAALEGQHRAALRRVTCASALVLIGLMSLFASQAATGWLDRLAPALAGNDPTVDFIDWRELRPLVEGLAAHRRAMVVATVSWIDAGKVDYALGGEVAVLCLSDDPRQFAYRYDLRRFAGRDALVVAAEGRKDYLAQAAPYFRRIVAEKDMVLTRAGRPALMLHTAWGYGLKLPPAAMAARADARR